MTKRNRVLSTVLAFALTLSVTAGVSVQKASAAGTFADVPDYEWYYSYIERAASMGWINGVDDGTMFAPDGTLSYAQLLAMLTRTFFQAQLDADPTVSDIWYIKNVRVADQAGLIKGTVLEAAADLTKADPAAEVDWTAAGADSLATRYEMAQILYNTASILTDSMDNADLVSAAASIADWGVIPPQYCVAVAACYQNQLLSGVDGGNFAGEGTVTRSQGAAILCRLYDLVGSVEPLDPGIGLDPEVPGAGDQPENPGDDGLQQEPGEDILPEDPDSGLLPEEPDTDAPSEEPGTGNPPEYSDSTQPGTPGKDGYVSSAASSGFITSDPEPEPETSLIEIGPLNNLNNADGTVNLDLIDDLNTELTRFVLQGGYKSSRWYTPPINELEYKQCTWWVRGRALEYLMNKPGNTITVDQFETACRGNGGDYYTNNIKAGLFAYGTTPKPHSLAVFRITSPRQVYGHVSYVEAVDYVNQIYYMSEAGSGNYWGGIKAKEFGSTYYSPNYGRYYPAVFIYLDEPLI